MSTSDPKFGTATKATLLLRLKADGEARELAWSDFVEFYAPIIRNFARRFTSSVSEIDEVLQEVITGFYQASPRFTYDPSRGRFRGYLKTCTTRVIRDRLAKKARIGGTSIEDVDPAAPVIEEAWADAWETEQLHRAVKVVREKYSTRPDMATTFAAFEMNVLFERPAKDVARELNISIESVHAAKSRITKAIRTQMQRQQDSIG